uniref:Uncharacterized protein n=1 Tax=Hyaloperonospora arabidopsidis (strain Emoy2) TaxID=559515 RepID=M4BG88_HYAAE
MLGFQYVVAKSRELSSALDRELSAASNRSIPFRSVPTSSSVETALPNDAVAATEAPVASSLSVRHEGHTFLNSQHKRYAEAVRNHDQLLKQGQALDAVLSSTRVKLQTEAASEQYVTQNFHLVSKLRQQLAQVRTLVLKVVEEVDQVESLLVKQCEERAALQNAEVAFKQQQELECFEMSIAEESEGRRRELLERRRQKLASAFADDLKTYQTLVDHHKDAADASKRVLTDEEDNVTLDEVDLVVSADPEQLDAFYGSGSERDEEECLDPRCSTSLVLKELAEREKDEEETEAAKMKEMDVAHQEGAAASAVDVSAD